MLNVKTIYRFLFAMALVVIPSISLGMESSDNHQPRGLALFPQRAATGLKDGAVLVAKATKDTAVAVAQKAYEHPVYTALAVGGAYTTYRLLSYIATQKDLDKTSKELNEHRHGLVKAVVALQDTNQQKTTAQFATLAERQDELLEKLGAMSTGVSATSTIILQAYQQAKQAKEDQKIACDALALVTRENVQASKACGLDLHALKISALDLAKQQEALQQETDLLLSKLEAENAESDVLLAQLSKNGQALQQVELQAATLAQKFKTMSEQLEAARAKESSVTVIPQSREGHSNK